MPPTLSKIKSVTSLAKLVTDLIFDNVGGKDQFDHVDVQLIRTDHDNPLSNEEAQASLRISVMSQNPDLVGRLFSAKIVELYNLGAK